MDNFFSYQALDAKKNNFDLQDLKGQVVLVVNVASQCGYTPQYTGLETLQKKYSEKGFTVLAFPCNQFGQQEPGSDSEIQQFCQLNYKTSFPVMAKVDVNGSEAAPVYQFLKNKAPGLLGTEMIKWNFTKFLISRKGEVIARYAPQTKPEEIALDIEKALSESLP